MASTLAGGWYNVNSTVMFSTGAMYVTASTLSSSYGVQYAPVGCDGVSLSSVTGAKCACGKFSMDAKALPLSLPMSEIRQVVSGAYKLTHGSTLRRVYWQAPDENKGKKRR